MAKYLRRAGHHVEILTTSAFGRLDEEAERWVHRTDDLISARWLRALLRRPPLPQGGAPAEEDTPPPQLLTKLLVPDVYVASWMPFAARACRRLVAERQFDCVVTTSAYESTHVVGLALGRSRPVWLADFRDGWTFHPWKPPFPTQLQRRIDVGLERRVVRSADRVLVVERPVGEDFRHRLGVHPAYVPNGWDPELGAEADAASPPEISSGKVLLVHTGKLSGGWGRHPGTLFEALLLVRQRAPELADRLQLVLAGRLDRAERELIEATNAEEMIRWVGHLSRADAMALQRRAAALVLITAPNLVWELPGKVFEYMGARRPILALAHGNEAARVIEETGIGTCVAPGDVPGIASLLERVAKGEPLGTYDDARLRDFVYPAPAEAVIREMEAALSARERGG